MYIFHQVLLHRNQSSKIINDLNLKLIIWRDTFDRIRNNRLYQLYQLFNVQIDERISCVIKNFISYIKVLNIGNKEILKYIKQWDIFLSQNKICQICQICNMSYVKICQICNISYVKYVKICHMLKYVICQRLDTYCIIYFTLLFVKSFRRAILSSTFMRNGSRTI